MDGPGFRFTAGWGGIVKLCTILTNSLLASALLTGCLVDESQPGNPSVEELTQFPSLKPKESEFWYSHIVYTSTPYLGNPDSTLTLLAELGIFPKEVWGSTGEACVLNGDSISPGYTFIMRLDRDYGTYIHNKNGEWSPFMIKVRPEWEWALDFEPCDTGRRVKHYRFP